MDESRLADLLDRVASGELPADVALEHLRGFPYEKLADATIDHHRELRTGQAEAIYGPGKTSEQVRDATAALVARASGAVFVTRASPEQFHALLGAVPGA
ncbi:MAG: nickel pincer cofactor biosynthesis protein LarB, partial [Actinomycetota bacterium]